jgi:uncharacterized membrane protein
VSSYLLLKFIHILSAVIMAGTGLGTAFFMFMAYRSRDLDTMALTSKHVVIADWCFTTPAIIVQVISGILLMITLGYSFQSAWFMTVAGLYIFVGACWIPVLFIQYRLKSIAELQVQCGSVKEEFAKLMKIWTGLGILAFPSVLILFALMVFKPLAVI